MADTAETVTQRDRSPSFPVVGLKVAFERLVEFETYFKRSAARPEKVGDAWNITTKAYADRIAAALRYFGLLEYQGAGKERTIAISEEGRKYLRAQQEETKREVIKAAALRPKQIAECWELWSNDRPADAACIDDLVQNRAFSVAGARDFLKVYDSTISYAGLTATDKVAPKLGDSAPEEVAESGFPWNPPSPKPPAAPSPQQGKVKLMDGERIVFTEESNPQSYLKLIASGDVDEMMLEALEDYVKRQKRRLGAAAPRAAAGAGGQVPFMITQAQKEALREKGFEDDKIATMTPEKAHQLLGLLPPLPYAK
jgi:hypothetical protein